MPYVKYNEIVQVAKDSQEVIWIDDPEQYTCKNICLPRGFLYRFNKRFEKVWCYRLPRPRIPLSCRDQAHIFSIYLKEKRKTCCRCWPFNSSKYTVDDSGQRLIIETHGFMAKCVAIVGWVVSKYEFFPFSWNKKIKYICINSF
jgi:hypothetical protein